MIRLLVVRENLAYLPLAVLGIVCGGIVLVWLGEQLGRWLIARSDRAPRPVRPGSRDRALRGKARIRARRADH